MTALLSTPNSMTNPTNLMPSITRDLILSTVKEWIGTPYMHQCWSKGLGCDCLGLVIGVYEELYGLIPKEPPPYTPSWAENDPQEQMLEAAREHLIEIPNVSDAKPGDVLLFQMMPNRPIKHAAFLSKRVDGVNGTGGMDGWSLIHAYSGHAVMETAMISHVGSRMAYAFKFPGVLD